MNSTLEFQWRERVRESSVGQSPRRFLDFSIDGRSFYDAINNDLISPFGWLPLNQTDEAIQRLLLNSPSDLPENRRSLYICPECADVGCGSISAVIEQTEDGIVWRDFGHQNNYDGEVRLDPYKNFGPFTFERAAYELALNYVRRLTADENKN